MPYSTRSQSSRVRWAWCWRDLISARRRRGAFTSAHACSAAEAKGNRVVQNLCSAKFLFGQTAELAYGQPATDAAIVVQPNFDIVFLHPKCRGAGIDPKLRRKLTEQGLFLDAR